MSQEYGRKEVWSACLAAGAAWAAVHSLYCPSSQWPVWSALHACIAADAPTADAARWPASCAMHRVSVQLEYSARLVRAMLCAGDELRTAAQASLEREHAATPEEAAVVAKLGTAAFAVSW